MPAKPRQRKGSSTRTTPKHSNDNKRTNAVGKDGMRSASTVKRLAMYNTKAKRNKQGKIISEEFQSKDLPNTRIVPDRRWFGNTRVIGQKQLADFREDMAAKTRDPFSVILQEKKLPMSLIEDPEKAAQAAGRVARANLVQVQPFADTFGSKQRRKRPTLPAESYDGLIRRVDEVEQGYDLRGEGADRDALARLGDAPGAWAPGPDDARDARREPLFEKGQSRRIWGELYKVIDSSDVVLQVLDARDPMGTRSRYLERHLRKNHRQKQLILVLNKCDLVPAWVTKRWLHALSREYPTLAFHASLTSPFGKGSLLGLLRQLSRLRTDKKYISVGLVGYPNVGKSSVINALRSKRVCGVAPVPGQTKVWQYITLTKKIFLIDCPGVVHGTTKDTDTQAVLKGVVRVENLEDATEHVGEVLKRVKRAYVQRAYRVKDWESVDDFLAQIARSSGRLLRGGEPDYNSAAKMVLFDWQRGRLPFFTPPPDHVDEEAFSTTALDGAKADDGEVNGEDASLEGGEAADPAGTEAERAEAAKRALAREAARESRAQARGTIPVAENFFDDEDAAGTGSEGSSDDDEDALGTPVSSGSGSPVVSDDEDGRDGGSDSGEDSVEGTSSDDEGGADGGYGEGGLSWEAVMAAVGAEGSADPAPEEEVRRGKGGRAAIATGGKRGRVPAAAGSKRGAPAAKGGVRKARKGSK